MAKILWWITLPVRIILIVICAVALTIIAPMDWTKEGYGIKDQLKWLWQGGGND